ncbi:MAG: patatin-like phospholipase family protein [Thermoplasmatota archaeon]
MPALVVEGGSMRAAYASGVLAAFESAGYRDFDAIYGTSAGGALVAWFAAGQADYATQTWKYAQDRRFVSYRRVLWGGPIMDHDRLFADVYAREHPLNVAAVQAAPFPVIVTVTDADTGIVEYIDIRKGPVLDWLRATGRMPIGLGPAVLIGGKRYVDGGVVDPLPVERAIADGHRHLIVVANRPPGPRRAEARIVVNMVARRYPALRDLVASHHEVSNRQSKLLERAPAGVTLDVIRPLRDTGLGRLTRDLSVINAGIAQGRSDGAAWVRSRGFEDASGPAAAQGFAAPEGAADPVGTDRVRAA